MSEISVLHVLLDWMATHRLRSTWTKFSRSPPSFKLRRFLIDDNRLEVICRNFDPLHKPARIVLVDQQAWIFMAPNLQRNGRRRSSWQPFSLKRRLTCSMPCLKCASENACPTFMKKSWTWQSLLALTGALQNICSVICLSQKYLTISKSKKWSIRGRPLPLRLVRLEGTEETFKHSRFFATPINFYFCKI